ncbi:O-antigen ligase [Humitalea rosea]|uniref:O-antigen ligase n=1 Tax=Humitalea rosea TaxID=990373 RepID=A0A2W7IS43_9PROT|nr:O-antigen ligase family protein [Humitalea rosea]PZW50426.1 O-antigen ligase [Humitalea rosea]
MTPPPVPARPSYDPSRPIAVLLLLTPILAVIQFRGLAPAILIGLLATVFLAWRRDGRLPLPRGAASLILLGFFAWALLGAAWAMDAGRAIETSLRLGAFAMLGAAAASAVTGADEAARARLGAHLAWGLGIGAGFALADHLSGNALRGLMRGQWTPSPHLYAGLKPAVSVMAVLLPILAFLPSLPRWLRLVLTIFTVIVVQSLIADAAKIAVLVGLAAGALAWWRPRLVAAGLGIGLAVVFLATPLAIRGLTNAGPDLSHIPPSAAHRVLIWEFVNSRIAERPIFGWGLESGRAMPGGKTPVATPTLDRFGLNTGRSPDWLRTAAEQLPLHPHNGAMEVWLDLGLVGALLASALAWSLSGLALRVLPAAAGLGAMASVAVVGQLSYGIWQAWWIGLQMLVVVALAALLPRGPSARG